MLNKQSTIMGEDQTLEVSTRAVRKCRNHEGFGLLFSSPDNDVSSMPNSERDFPTTQTLNLHRQPLWKDETMPIIEIYLKTRREYPSANQELAQGGETRIKRISEYGNRTQFTVIFNT